MPFYVGEWTQTGTRPNPVDPESTVPAYAPRGVAGIDWKVIDLVFDWPAVIAGGGFNALLLHSITPQTDPSFTLLADSADAPVSAAIKNGLINRLGLSSLVGASFRGILIELLTNPPPGKWKAITRSTRGLREIHLGDLHIRL